MDTDKIASTHLGKKSLGSEVYNPSLLVAVPREENRKQYGISNSGKLKVESGKLLIEGKKIRGLEGKPNNELPSPLEGEGCFQFEAESRKLENRGEGLIEEQKISGLEDKLFNDNHVGASNDAPYTNDSLNETSQEQLPDNDLFAYSPIRLFTDTNLSTDNSLPSCPLAFLPFGLPFIGYDIWHAYEFSCMTESGIPITRVMKMKYPCDNEFLVESKSLKLYLNSFNMMRLGKNTKECLEICKNMIEKDLSELLKTTVEINFLDKTAKKVEIFEDFENIMNFVDETAIQIIDFKENPEILQVEEAQEREYKLTFDSLRSNCRVTHQPDFGDAFIYYKSKKHIKEDSLVKYLTSFRSEYHFHEECCEMIFKRLSDILDEDDELMVCALYTRRGGIDICPVRWSGKLKVESGKLNAPYIFSDFSQQPQTDMDLSPYRPIALSPYANDIKALLNIQIFARNGIKQ